MSSFTQFYPCSAVHLSTFPTSERFTFSTYLYQKDERALPGKLHSHKYVLPDKCNVIHCSPRHAVRRIGRRIRSYHYRKGHDNVKVEHTSNKVRICEIEVRTASDCLADPPGNLLHLKRNTGPQ
jgi:hypothetical protein